MTKQNSTMTGSSPEILQWKEGDTATQESNESNAVQESPANSLSEAEQSSMDSELSTMEFPDTIERANYNFTWD